jgi:hypothetical protein
VDRRWTSSDPIGLKAGVNRFVYARGAPTCYSDYSGLVDWEYWNNYARAAILETANTGTVIAAHGSGVALISLVHMASGTGNQQSNSKTSGGTSGVSGGGRVRETTPEAPHDGGVPASSGELAPPIGGTGRAGDQQRLRDIAKIQRPRAPIGAGSAKNRTRSTEDSGKPFGVLQASSLLTSVVARPPKGYDDVESPSHLQDIDAHRTQHRLDDFGRANKERK